jgi:hypothetical protein
MKARAGQQFDVVVDGHGGATGGPPCSLGSGSRCPGGIHREDGAHEESVAGNPVEQLQHCFDTGVVHSLCVEVWAGTAIVCAGWRYSLVNGLQYHSTLGTYCPHFVGMRMPGGHVTSEAAAVPSHLHLLCYSQLLFRKMRQKLFYLCPAGRQRDS